jgi:hypothetical protein
VVGLSTVEGFKELVRLYKAVLECYERHIVLQKSYPDVLRLKPETVLRLGELLGHENFVRFMQGLLVIAKLVEEAGEKLSNFTRLSPSEQEEIVLKLKEAVSLMESALSGLK